MKHLFEAEIFVDTVFSVESGAGSGNWFYVADYATMSEFQTDCAGWFNSQIELTSIRASAKSEHGSTLHSACRKFSDEANPEYVYPEWWGIPDWLITRTWLCPNLFEIRNALQMLDMESIGPFTRWCHDNGHDLRTDDPMMLVTRYQDYVPSTCETPDPDVPEPQDDTIYTEPLHLLLGQGFGRVEIFDDNYN